ncbi:hypothetical protein L3i22_055300 [Actinoplanes sp. L3-i22]|nr:hypothetical protein L3i22_055300 [Actinoplanes sp. L3-i22]
MLAAEGLDIPIPGQGVAGGARHEHDRHTLGRATAETHRFAVTGADPDRHDRRGPEKIKGFPVRREEALPGGGRRSPAAA